MMRDFITQVFWPRVLLGKLGRILGALSVLALIRYGFEFGLAQTVQVLLDYYERALQAAFGWAEPYFEGVLSWLRTRFNWELSLYPHWKHIFVLVGIYLFRSAENTFRRRKVTGTWRFFLGLIIAPATSIATGVVPLTRIDWTANFLIATIPVLGIFTYNVANGVWNAAFLQEYEKTMHDVEGWGEIFLGHLFAALRRTLVAIVLVLGGLQVPFIRNLPSPGLFLLAMLVGLLAFVFMREGFDQGKRTGTPYWQTGGAKLGAAMLGVFFWTGLFVLLNAGLDLVGL